MHEPHSSVFVYEDVLKQIIEVCRQEEVLDGYEEAGDGIHFTARISGEGTIIFEVLPGRLTLTKDGDSKPEFVFTEQEQLQKWFLFSICECWMSDLLDSEPPTPNLPD